MAYQFPRNWPGSDPAPQVPTLEQIQFAEELRHRLELRLLGRADDARTRALGAVQYDWGLQYED